MAIIFCIYILLTWNFSFAVTIKFLLRQNVTRTSNVKKKLYLVVTFEARQPESGYSKLIGFWIGIY